MHKMGVFVWSSAAFSEKDLGNDTFIYLNLISKMSEPQRTAFYNTVKISKGIVKDLKKCLRENLELLQNEPGGYRIHNSDPVDPNNNFDLE